MLIARSLALCGCILSLSAYAGTMGHLTQSDNSIRPWLAVASLGYTVIENSGPGTGETALGRFAIGKDLYEWGERDTVSNPFNASLMNFGFEFGVQNGTTLSLLSPRNTNGLYENSTLRPMLDLLGTMTVSPMESLPFFLSAKLGLAYRQWQQDNQLINNLSQVTGELQVGLGVPVGDAAALSIVYQGIYGSSPDITQDTGENTLHINNIPAQNSVLLSLTLLL